MNEIVQPYKYQLVGASFLAGKDQVLLADEMGLGKTAQVVLAADLINAENILIICPANVRINWSREFPRFSDTARRITVLMTGADKVPAGGTVVCSYDLLNRQRILDGLKRVRWDVLCIDEVHYLKTRTARRTRIIYGWGNAHGLITQARRVWRLTGTPAPNNYSELYPHLLSAGLIRQSYWDFVSEYCVGFESTYGFKITGHKNVPKLKKLLGEIMLRRKKDDELDLPPIRYHQIPIEGAAVDLRSVFFEQLLAGQSEDELRREIGSLEERLRASLSLIQDRPGQHENNAADDRVGMLSSMAPHMATYRRYVGMAKIPVICDIIADELASDPGLKIVLFGVHQMVIDFARRRLADFGPVTLYGATPQKKRQHNIDRFENFRSCRVFIGNIQAAGVGISLTAASEVVIAEPDWVPGNISQAVMRCHRIGQKRPVRVRYFTLAGSLDEDIVRVVRLKATELARLFT
jgi:SWI/SNF-related matrix-associated actin-dependent regulator 1 of chromatin subfamily A